MVDTERLFSLNRRLALQLLRQRIERGDEAARRAATAARWRIHDELVRGNPSRIERPETSGPGPQESAPQRRRQSTTQRAQRP